MLNTFTRWATPRLGAFIGAAALLVAAGPVSAQTVFGLSGSNLVSFNATAPAAITSTTAIMGVTTGQTLVGLDFRPNTGELFALGYNYDTTAPQAQLYTINPTSGMATAVGTALTLNLGSSTDRIGFDFNPTVDRIRVVSTNDANVRLNPNNGALAFTDGPLAYATATTEPNAGQNPGVGAAAYTNSYIGTGATTLYDIDEINSRLVSQNPPNIGTLNTVGALGITISAANQSTDLDIYYNPTTNTNAAYMSVATDNSTMLYTVSLTNGATTSVGMIGLGTTPVTDITFQITRAVPATVTGQLVYGLVNTGVLPTLTSNLVTFDSNLPGTIRSLVAITGLDANQSIVGMDIRPATNSIYALGYNATAQTGQVYTINATTGAAKVINTTPVALMLGTGKVGFDFNPTVDRIRVVGQNGMNYRLNPVDGSIAFTDTNLSYTAGDANASATPAIGAVAYTNSAAGATTTTLYDYDLALNILATQTPPNEGKLNTVGATGITVNATTPNVDMDIFYAAGTTTNTAYLVANTGTAANTTFYTLSLTGTPTATAVGTIGNGVPVRDIAITSAAGVTATTSARELAAGLSLYPNPLVGEGTVSFKLTQPTQVELTVTDALGRQVEVLKSGMVPAGNQVIRWNSKAQTKGVYLIRLTLDGQPAGTRRGLVVN
ncbi:MAG TPA: DUF4394 domain-containing protein [Hymenobacter sp.]|jgi:hypothetical protein